MEGGVICSPVAMTPDSPCLAKARSFLSALFPQSPPLRSMCASVCVHACVCVCSLNLGESYMMHMMEKNPHIYCLNMCSGGKDGGEGKAKRTHLKGK